MPLADHQWELLSEDGEVDLVFGTADTGIQTAHAPDLGQRSIRSSDAPLPREDGTAFGPDYDDGTTITFEVNVLADSWADQSDLLDLLWSSWRYVGFRDTAQRVGILRSRNAGRTRICYGRPRRFAETDADLTHEGYTGAAMDFVTWDGRFYDDEEKSASVSMAPQTTPGFTTPIMVTGTGSNTVAFQTQALDPADLPASAVVVSGEATWPVITFHGPVLRPSAQIGNLLVELDYDIPDGYSVTVDPRPWARSVTGADGANLAGYLSYRTPPLSACKVKAGSRQLIFRGTSNTHSAWCEVRWRNCHSRP